MSLLRTALLMFIHMLHCVARQEMSIGDTLTQPRSQESYTGDVPQIGLRMYRE